MRQTYVKRALLVILSLAILVSCSWGEDKEKAIYDESKLSDEIIQLKVEEGMNVSGIATLLASAGVISDAELFRYYCSNRGIASMLQAGLYEFTIGMSVASAADKIASGDVYRPTYRFSIPEGSNIRQIAQAAERQGFCSEEEFLAAAQNSTLRPLGDGVIFALEGYLFPATYTWDYILTPAELLEAFYAEALQRLEDLEVPENHPLTKEEIVILASILEKESQYDDEREIVAGVFLNRLELEMPLQSCATVNYLLPEVKEVLTYADLEIDSPYNTYIYSGLPIGPISSPGELALKAVLFPVETDYLYFVVSEDGKHIFSCTYEEHEAAAAWLGE